MSSSPNFLARPAFDLQLFAHLNASPAASHGLVVAALAIAQALIWLVPAGLVLAWLRGGREQRAELLEMAVAVLLALGLGQLVALAWPLPRPFMLHLGSQFLAHSADAGMPSDHVTVFWSLACAAVLGRRHAGWAIALFAVGLAVGLSRVFLGVHFPLDVAAALPVALAGSLAARAARPVLQPAYGVLQDWYAAFLALVALP